MTFAFYFDENVSEEIAIGSASSGLDVVTTRQDNHAGDVDENILDRSVALDRVLVTCDVDFLVIARKLVDEGKRLSPIVFFAQGSLTTGQIIEDLTLIAHAAVAEDFHYEVVRLPLR